MRRRSVVIVAAAKVGVGLDRANLLEIDNSLINCGFNARTDRQYNPDPLRIVRSDEQAQEPANGGPTTACNWCTPRWSSSLICESTMSLIRKTGNEDPQ